MSSWVPSPSQVSWGSVSKTMWPPCPGESSSAISPGHTDPKGYVPGAGVSSWSPEGVLGVGWVCPD